MVFFLCFNDGARRLWGLVLSREAAAALPTSHQATENLCLALFFACIVINVARAAFYTFVLARREWPEASTPCMGGSMALLELLLALLAIRVGGAPFATADAVNMGFFVLGVFVESIFHFQLFIYRLDHAAPAAPMTTGLVAWTGILHVSMTAQALWLFGMAGLASRSFITATLVCSAFLAHAALVKVPAARARLMRAAGVGEVADETKRIVDDFAKAKSLVLPGLL